MQQFSSSFGMALIVLAFSSHAQAQLELITIERPLSSRSLAGVVVDPTGAPVSGVVVEECDALFTPVQPRGPAEEPVRGVLEGDCD